MQSLQKILVPTDLSPEARHILTEAQRFAESFSASIDLLYVWSPPPLVGPETLLAGVGMSEQPLLEMLEGNAHEQLDRFTNDVRSAGIQVANTFCEQGDPASAIVERAESGHYDLLVLGTHGRSGLSHLLLGSVTEKVVRNARCPVLTVRAGD